MLVLYFIGTHVESLLGSRRFLGLYLTSVFSGGLLWLLFHFNSHGLVVGASAATIGILICFCALLPNQPITFLLFFIIPVTMKPKWLAAIIIGFELFGFLFHEIQGQGASDIAYSAHLGGALGSYLFFLFIIQRGFSFSRFIPQSIRIEKPNRSKNKGVARRFTLNITGQKNTQEEVDRILDKINTMGFASLTQDEKDFLDKAKDLLK
jgi:membrane associated rhomboid family serine protease